MSKNSIHKQLLIYNLTIIAVSLKDIASFNSLFASLFEAEHQINPVMQLAGHVIRLECFTMFVYEVICSPYLTGQVISLFALDPARELYIT